MFEQIKIFNAIKQTQTKICDSKHVLKNYES